MGSYIRIACENLDPSLPGLISRIMRDIILRNRLGEQEREREREGDRLSDNNLGAVGEAELCFRLSFLAFRLGGGNGLLWANLDGL